MGYQTGLSGLQGAADDLNVIGNNIANANTVGFKSGEAVFSDLYANSIYGAQGNEVGLGVDMTSVEQDFSTSTFTTNDNPYDLAINGNGFFVVSNSGGGLAYTRDGQFEKNSDNVITTASGMPLMGYAVNANGATDTSQLVPMSLANYQSMPPQATSSVAWKFNLDSSDQPPTVTPFDPTNSSSYNYSSSVSVYDSEGDSHQLNIYFVASGTPGQWTAYLGSGSSSTSVGTGTGAGASFVSLGTIGFNSSGTLTVPTSGTFSVDMQTTNGSVTPQPVTLNLAGTTGFGLADTVTGLTPNGYSAGSLSNFSIGTNGQVTANYSNDQTQVIGQVALANFNDPNGLLNSSGNLYEQTSASGVAQINTPGTDGMGGLLDGEEENSNVDLTSQLVDLITAQRNYQANAQTIKTQQTVDQTLLNM